MCFNLANVTELVHERLSDTQLKIRTWYNKKSHAHHYKVGEEVNVLLPTSSKSLQAEW